ncbi:MAG: Hpt domain-containing protein [Eubacterium sp.]|nr:Hpt domain-containing protein [Eubacterium sp.]
MLTIDGLKAIGADTDPGLERCLNNEAFYLRLVGMAASDENFGKLREAVEKDDLDTAFECAHALKGVLANVSLTNVLEPIKEITEDLRARTEKDYSGQLDKIDEELAKVKALM